MIIKNVKIVHIILITAQIITTIKKICVFNAKMVIICHMIMINAYHLVMNNHVFFIFFFK